MGKRLRIGRRLEVYVEPRDIWIGAFIGESAVYVLLLPCLVIRWDRTKRNPQPADPPVSLMHRTMCADLTAHIAPIGFDANESGWDGIEHGESMRDDAVREQCMCGHSPYYLHCPDWLMSMRPSLACRSGDHREKCSRFGWNDDLKEWQMEMCPCICHDLPLSEAIKEAARA